MRDTVACRFLLITTPLTVSSLRAYCLVYFVAVSNEGRLPSCRMLSKSVRSTTSPIQVGASRGLPGYDAAGRDAVMAPRLRIRMEETNLASACLSGVGGPQRGLC